MGIDNKQSVQKKVQGGQFGPSEDMCHWVFYPAYCLLAISSQMTLILCSTGETFFRVEGQLRKIIFSQFSALAGFVAFREKNVELIDQDLCNSPIASLGPSFPPPA